MPNRNEKPPHPWLGKRVRSVKTPLEVGGICKSVDVNGAVVIVKDNGELIILPDNKVALVDG